MTGNQRESALDRRRRKLHESRDAAEGAVGAVRQLEKQIDANAEQSRASEAQLRAAQDQVATLKKAIKASTKDAERLRDARKAARQRAVQAQQRSSRAEGKYDDAVLAELVRREKSNDLAAHSAERRPDTGRAGDDATRDAASSGHDMPDTEAPDDTARRTASRRTAAEARTSTGSRSRGTRARGADGNGAGERTDDPERPSSRGRTT